MYLGDVVKDGDRKQSGAVWLSCMQRRRRNTRSSAGAQAGTSAHGKTSRRNSTSQANEVRWWHCEHGWSSKD